MRAGRSSTGLGFDNWFSPLSLTEFTRSVLGRKIYLTPPREDLARRLRDVMGVHSVDEVLTKQVQRVFAWFYASDGQNCSTAIPAASAQRLYDAGITLFIQQVAEFAPFEREAAGTFRVTGNSAKCQLFCNRPGAATRVHFDPIDVITVQLTGRKVWRVAPNTFAPLPLEGWGPHQPVFPNMRNYVQGTPPVRIPDDAGEYVLEPGAVLHVPRGYWHETRSDQDSISLHILLIPPLRADFLLASLKNELLRQPRWRESVYGFETPDEIEARLADDRAAVRGALDRLDWRDLARTAVVERPIGPGVKFVRAGQAAFGIDEVTGDTATVSVTAYGFQETTTSTVQLDRELLPLLEHVDAMPTGASLDITDMTREIPGLPEANAQALLLLLEQARLIRRVV